MQSTRTFIAVEIGPPAVSALLRLLNTLRQRIDKVRWIRPEQMHVTIKFLGEIDNVQLPRVCSILRSACSGIEPFRVNLGGIGTFPKNKPPRVVWVGMRDVIPLVTMHERLDEQLAELGVPREGRAFSPHLTLGRVGRSADIPKLMQLLQDMEPLTESDFEIEEVLLVASVKENRQVIYEPIDHVDLQEL